MKLKVKRLSKSAKLPARGTGCSAGMDLHVLKEYTLIPGETVKLPTGLALEIPPGFAGVIQHRSSTFARGLVCLGLVDADYRGEVQVVLTNISSIPLSVTTDKAVAQLVVLETPYCEIVEADELSETQRGTGGFGSTDQVSP